MDITERRMAADALRAIKRGGEGWFSLSDAVLGRPAPRDEVVARLADLIDPGEDTTVDAYDLLPVEEREALRWVHGHGGLHEVCRDYQGAYNRRVELCAALGIDMNTGWSDACEELRKRIMPPGFEWTGSFADAVEFMDCAHDLLYTIDGGEHTSNEMVAEMVKRLMPEGCEWPRCDNGEKVYFGDEVSRFGDVFGVSAICLYYDGSYALNFKAYSKGERVKLHEEALAADGEPLEVGQTVWDEHGDELRVLSIVDDHESHVMCHYEGTDGTEANGWWLPHTLTHQRPVLDADGVIIHEGDTVYDKDTGDRFEVAGFSYDGVVCTDIDACESDIEILPSQLTHTKPKVDTWDTINEESQLSTCEYFDHMGGSCHDCPGGPAGSCHANMMADIVRRAKALAVVSE